MECQQGVIGNLARFDALRAEVERKHLISNIAKIADNVRSIGRPVVHCCFGWVPTAATNAPLLRMTSFPKLRIDRNQPDALVCPELIASGDEYSWRSHGVSPVIGTDLVERLVSHQTTTVIVVGVSLNVGIVGAAIELVNSGFELVVVRDAVAATSPMVESVALDATIAQLAEIVTSEELCHRLVDSSPSRP